jgi:hypothetical protein
VQKSDPKVEKAIIQQHSILGFDDRLYFFLPKDESEFRKAEIERFSKRDATFNPPKEDEVMEHDVSHYTLPSTW